MQQTKISTTNEVDKINEAVQFILNEISHLRSTPPRVGIVCGSGLGKLADLLDKPHGAISYSVIPHFVASTVVGHCGELVFGKKCGVELVCMRGRVHLYEGYSPADCVRPIRVMAALGVQVLIVTNAAGNLNPSFNPGDFMIIKDHISFPTLSGENPLRGAHQEALGERFVTMNNVYDKQLIEMLEKVGKKSLHSIGNCAAAAAVDGCCAIPNKLQPLELRKGIYIMVSGPTFETVAEAKLMRMIGGDAAGMSTANEITVAHQMGVRCLAVSLLTNNVNMDYEQSSNATIDDKTLHQEVVQMANKRSSDFVLLITELLLELKPTLASDDDSAKTSWQTVIKAVNVTTSNQCCKVKRTSSEIKSTLPTNATTTTTTTSDILTSADSDAK